MKLLQELDLIQQTNVEEDSISINSLDSLEDMKSTDKKEDTLKINSISYLTVDSSEKNIKHVRSLSDVSDLHTEPISDQLNNKECKNGNLAKNDLQKPIPTPKKEELKTSDYTLSVRFIETGKNYKTKRKFHYVNS